MREIRRRTVGAFPDGQSCLNLAAARLRYIAGFGMVSQTIYEHAAPLSDAVQQHWSRHLIGVRKNLDATII
jgi:hypothetical protein